jgi:hypothetical protein
MKALFALIVAGTAGLMAWLFWQGECRDGVSARTAEECAASGAIPRAVCDRLFGDADRVVRNAATVFPDESRCREQFAVCVPHAAVVGFAPVPARFCVSPAKGGAAGAFALTPIYERINAQPVGGR